MMAIVCVVFFFFFFKQKTAYEMSVSDWSSDVCSSDLRARAPERARARGARDPWTADHPRGPPRAAPGRGRRAGGRADGRTVRSACGLARGDRARLDPARARDDEVEQAGGGGAARAPAPDALLEDAQARHPAAPAVGPSPAPETQARSRLLPIS